MRTLLLALALALPSLAEDFAEAVDKALANADAPPPSARANALYQQQKWDEAAHAYLEQVTRQPDDANSWYNLACCLSLGGHGKEAVKALERSFKTGFNDLDHVAGDTDLDPIRKRKSYKALVEKAKKEQGEKPEKLWIEGRALLPCSIVKPEKFDASKEYGLVMLLHGRGDNAERFASHLGRLRGDDFIVAALESPYVLGMGPNGRMHSWSVWESGAGNVETAYKLSVDSVGKALKALEKEFKLDKKRVFLMGFSEGGFLSAYCGIRMGSKIAGYICIGGGLHPSMTEDGDWQGLKGKRILIAHGVSDKTVPFKAAKLLSESLEAQNIEHELVPYAGGHVLPPELLEAVEGWLRGKAIPEDLKQEEPE